MNSVMCSQRHTLRPHLPWLARLHLPLSWPSDETQIDIQINIRKFSIKVYLYVLL